jgi:hypothetical protein
VHGRVFADAGWIRLAIVSFAHEPALQLHHGQRQPGSCSSRGGCRNNRAAGQAWPKRFDTA